MNTKLKNNLEEFNRNTRAIKEASSEDKATIQIGGSKVTLNFESHPDLREDFLKLLEKHNDYISDKARENLNSYLN